MAVRRVLPFPVSCFPFPGSRVLDPCRLLAHDRHRDVAYILHVENLAAGTGNYDIAAAVKGWTDEACE